MSPKNFKLSSTFIPMVECKYYMSRMGEHVDSERPHMLTDLTVYSGMNLLNC